MKCSLGLASLTLLAVIGQAHAADDLGGFVDLRLGYETFNTKYTLGYPGVEAEENFDITHRLSLTWMGSLGLRSYGGVLWGIGGTWYYNNEDELPAGNGAFTYQTWLAQFHLGYGLPLGSNMQLELVPYIGFGRAYIRSDDFPRQPGQSQNGEDATWEAGINASFIYTFDSGFQLGANARYFYTRSHVSDKAGGFEYDMEIQDFALGAMIGARL